MSPKTAAEKRREQQARLEGATKDPEVIVHRGTREPYRPVLRVAPGVTVAELLGCRAGDEVPQAS